MVWVVGMINLLCLPLAGRRSRAVLPPFSLNFVACNRLAMLSHSTRHPPCLASGGTLARVISIRAGLFPYPSRTSLGALCSVLLTRDARSLRGRGRLCVGANRAVCTEERRGLAPWSRRCSSLRFREAAHQLRTHNADRHHAARLGEGAAGLVLRIALPRPSILREVNHTHQNSSVGYVSHTAKPKRERLICLKKGLARWQRMQ